MKKNLLEDQLREEVEFWRSFIDDWKRVNRTPPLPRMLDALTYAEHKLRHYLALTNQLERDNDMNRRDDTRH